MQVLILIKKNSDSKRQQQSLRMDSQTSIEYQEKDAVYEHFEEFNKLNQRTKQIFLKISKQTFDLFHSLSNLKLKNKKVIQKNKKSNMMLDDHVKFEKEDILQTLTNDVDLADEMSEFDLNEPGN